MRSADIARLLPWVFQRTLEPGSPLDAILATMEGLHAPSDASLAGIDRYFDPRRTPDNFVPFLARWLDLDRVLVRPAQHYFGPGGADEPLQSGVGRLRELVASAAYLSRWRGTAAGILRFLEIATGVRGFQVDEQVPGRPFFVAFTMPKAAEPYQALVRRIIELEKPAHLDYELTIAT
jgi:phage tail-like protein